MPNKITALHGYTVLTATDDAKDAESKDLLGVDLSVKSTSVSKGTVVSYGGIRGEIKTVDNLPGIPPVKEGQEVWYSPLGAENVEADGTKYVIVPSTNLMAVCPVK